MKHNVLLKNIDMDNINNYKYVMAQVSHVFEELAKTKQGDKQETCKKIINNCQEIIDLLNNITTSII